MTTQSAAHFPGDLVELTIGAPAHGGHCVARLDGRVIFVRHAIEGERAIVRLTETARKGFWRGDAIEILAASPDRVTPAWGEAGPGGVGGAEMAHVAPAAARAWKARVLAEQFARLADLEIDVPVAGIAGDDEAGGMGYRTRVQLVASEAGRVGMRAFRSHRVVELDEIPLATPAAASLLADEDVFGRTWQPGTLVTAVAPADGSAGMLLVDDVPWHHGRFDRRPNARQSVAESVRVGSDEFSYRVAAAGFWQVHRQAPETLVGAVIDLVGRDELSGSDVFDLYSGAGLFTQPLAHAVGAAGTVLAVESGQRALRDARRNLRDYSTVSFVEGRVEQVFSADSPARADVVVLDPPRAGAGRRVVDAIASGGVPRVVYVACDPASLARDVATFTQHGYHLEELRAFDIFPATHHFESVALLVRD